MTSIDFNCLLTQKNAIQSMLDFHQGIDNDDNFIPKEPNWKVMVYDSVGANIIFLLFTVKELRNMGVTLLLPITNEDRQPIPETNIIYFISDTQDNINIIGNDMKKNLYDYYYICFLGNSSIVNLELLASYTLQYNSSTKICMIYDEYVKYLSLESNYFLVAQKIVNDHFLTINNPTTSDNIMENLCDSIVESLLSLLISLNTVPIIRSQKNNSSEMVADKLNRRIRDILHDGKSLFSWNPSNVRSCSALNYQRPLLVIVDRSIDIATPLRHSWTYQPLLHDLFNIDMNQVRITENDPTKNMNITKKYQLSHCDKFWNTYRHESFPNIADAMKEELDDYKALESRVTNLKNTNGLTTDENTHFDDNNIQQNTQKLSSAINSLPDLIIRKKYIDMHTTLASQILENIQERKLDRFYEIELKIINDMVTDQTISTFLAEKHGTNEDRIRSVLIKLLSSNDDDYHSFRNMIQSSSYIDDDFSCCFNFVDKWKKLSQIITRNDMKPYSSSRLNKDVSPFTSMSLQQGATHYGQIISRYIPSSSKKLVKGVKQLVLGSKNLPLTNVVTALMDQRQQNEISDFTYFDPKITLDYNSTISCEIKKTTFSYAIVFVIGGGCYFEYLDLLEIENKSTLNDPRKIIYGCSEQVTPTSFLKQLTKLSQLL